MRAAAKNFLSITAQAFPRGSDEAADKLAKLASSEERPHQKYSMRYYDSLRLHPKHKGLRPKNKRLRPKNKGLCPKQNPPT